MRADSTLPKILCLHGGGSSAAIFKCQLRLLQKALQTQFQLVFIDAPLEANAGPGILPVFEGCDPYYRWASDDQNLTPHQRQEEELQALHYVQDIMHEYGPFEVVLGFSQGARVAAALLSQGALVAESLLFVFICGTYPLFATPSPQHMHMLPTRVSVHYIGQHDPWRSESEQLLETCSRWSSVKVVKSIGGHHIPTQKHKVAELAEAVMAAYEEFSKQSLSIDLGMDNCLTALNNAEKRLAK
jgi:predicted esterase